MSSSSGEDENRVGSVCLVARKGDPRQMKIEEIEIEEERGIFGSRGKFDRNSPSYHKNELQTLHAHKPKKKIDKK